MELAIPAKRIKCSMQDPSFRKQAALRAEETTRGDLRERLLSQDELEAPCPPLLPQRGETVLYVPFTLLL